MKKICIGWALDSASAVGLTVWGVTLAVGCGSQGERMAQRTLAVEGSGDGGSALGAPDASSGLSASAAPTARRSRADWLRFRARVASLRGNTEEEDRLRTLAESGALEPRDAVPRRLSPFVCDEIRGPNVVRFKLREGSAVRWAEGRFRAESGASLRSEEMAALGALNSLSILNVQPTFRRDSAELARMRDIGQREGGRALADLTLWYDAIIGAYRRNVREDRPSCEQLTQVLNSLRDSSLIEAVEPVGEGVTTQRIPELPGDVDEAPTTPAWEPNAMRSSLGGVNTPETLSTLPWMYVDGWEGANVAIVSMEHSIPYTSEKLRAFTLIDDFWADPLEDHDDAWHSTVTLTLAAGSRVDSVTGLRFGLRGQAPRARRGYTASHEWPGLYDPGDGILRAMQRLERGDIVYTATVWDSGSLIPPYALHLPIESTAAARDAINTAAANGLIILQSAGNTAQDLAPHFSGVPRSQSFIVGGYDTTQGGTPYRASFSNFGWGIEVSAPGLVEVASDLPAHGSFMMSGSPLQTGQQSRFFFGGNSASTPILAGASARLLGIFRQGFGHVMGNPGAGTYETLRALLLEIGVVGDPSIGIQPDIGELALERVMTTRVDPCSPQLTALPIDRAIRPPHGADSAVAIGTGVTLDTTGIVLPTCAWRWPVGVTNPVTVVEDDVDATRGPLDLGHNPGDGFTLEARVAALGPNANWQPIVAKESPRNYGMWITPYGAGATPGVLHFSYQPQGSAALCPLYGSRVIADGYPHHVAVTFSRVSGSYPVILIFVDGVLDAVRTGCTTDPPAVQGSPGANLMLIGGNVGPETRIGDVRLYHYAAPASRIAQHAGNFL